MKCKILFVLFTLPVLAVSLGGCIIEGDGGGRYGHGHYWHDRDRW